MKQGELRRALMVATLLCLFLFIYLYWQQSSKPLNALVLAYKEIYSSNKKPHQPQWTWQCLNQRCERHHISENLKLTSLSTCSMLCGSTQLWPQPTGPVTLGSKALVFNANQFQFESLASGESRNFLTEAFASFNESVLSLVRGDHNYAKQKTDIARFIVRVTIVHGDVIKLKLNTDESYSVVLKCKDSDVIANVTAKTYFGARHGLETLSQLIW